MLSLETYRSITCHIISKHHLLAFDLAYFTGLRLSEVLTLRFDDLFLRHKTPRSTIIFKDRKIMVHPSLGELLILHQDIGEGNPLLFPSPNNPKKPLAARTLAEAFYKARDKAGLAYSGLSPKDISKSYLERLIAEKKTISFIELATGLSAFTIFRYTRNFQVVYGE